MYVRPLYVSSSQTAYPQLVDVVVVYGKQVSMAPTLNQALAVVFGASVPGGTGGAGSGTVPSQVRVLIAEAVQEYDAAQQALAKGNLGAYQADVSKAGQLLTQAYGLLKSSKAIAPSARAASAARTAARGTSASTLHTASASALVGAGDA